jgi:hypothetical protein
MEYFKIDGVDYSRYVNKLLVNTEYNYTSQSNASGNTVVDYINQKRRITVGFIPVNSEIMMSILSALDKFNFKVSFRNPKTGTLEENVNCIVSDTEIEYYTLAINNVMYNAFEVELSEL